MGAIQNCERTVGIRGDADFMGFAVEQDGKNARGDFEGICVGGLAIERDLPTRAVATEFDGAGFAGDLDLVFHGVRSSWARRPSSFQRESCCASGVAFAEAEFFVASE